MVNGEFGLELEHEVRAVVEVRHVGGHREPGPVHVVQVRRPGLRLRQSCIQRHLSQLWDRAVLNMQSLASYLIYECNSD